MKKEQIRTCENCNSSEIQTVASGTEHLLREDTPRHSFLQNNDDGTLIHEQLCGIDGCQGIVITTENPRRSDAAAEKPQYWCKKCEMYAIAEG